MGREIEFKAWHKIEKRMIDPVIEIDLTKGNQRICWYETMADAMSGCITDESMNNVELLQYTGLQDKNGREICEGDILQIPDLYETPENTSTTYHTAAVDFEQYGFRVDGSPLCEDYQYISDECEVVGNIYENADLIAEV